ncbi:hypothetical protein SIL73_14290 [Acidithiobacillus thiooxidans]|nr:hypothetical protein [Acidithiobacillus thiooxidans]MDX5935838.1 hypothetical protein [Acidithiobacillus thiooxidans]
MHTLLGHSPQRLENVCARTLHCGNARYKPIAEVLKKGLDQELLTPVDTQNDSTYKRGGRFLRDSRNLFHSEATPCKPKNYALRSLRLSGVLETLEAHNRQATGGQVRQTNIHWRCYFSTSNPS